MKKRKKELNRREKKIKERKKYEREVHDSSLGFQDAPCSVIISEFILQTIGTEFNS